MREPDGYDGAGTVHPAEDAPEPGPPADPRQPTQRVLDEVAAERARQRDQWGDEHDSCHLRADWVALLVHHLGRGLFGGIDGTDDLFRQQLVRVAALAVAAIEATDRRAAPPVPPAAVSLQARVRAWCVATFGATTADDVTERNWRFLEEALELVQALGGSAADAHQLVDYVFGRPVGEPGQEVGGVLITLSALCAANGLDWQAEGEREYARIAQPAVMAAIRAKQTRKPHRSPLPGGDPTEVPHA